MWEKCVWSLFLQSKCSLKSISLELAWILVLSTPCLWCDMSLLWASLILFCFCNFLCHIWSSCAWATSRTALSNMTNTRHTWFVAFVGGNWVCSFVLYVVGAWLIVLKCTHYSAFVLGKAGWRSTLVFGMPLAPREVCSTSQDVDVDISVLLGQP